MKRYILIPVILLSLVLGKAFYDVTRPEAGQIRFRVEGDTAYVNGHTDSHTYLAISKLKREHPQVRRLVFEYMSGTLDSASNMKLARQIRGAGYDTHLPARARIASGAVDLFISGNQRTIECGAMIGVHAWRDGYGRTAQDAGPDRFEPLHRAFLSDMGITPEFYSFTRAAASAYDMHWMSYGELATYGLLTQPPNCE